MKLKEIIQTTIIAGVFVGLVGFAYHSCSATDIVKDATVVEKGIYELRDDDSYYYDEHNKIVIDNGQCFHAPKPTFDDLEVGDIINELEYHSLYFGGCYRLDKYRK